MALTVNPTVSRSTRAWLVDSLAFFIGTALGGLCAALLATLLFATLQQALSIEGATAIAVTLIGWAVLRDFGLPLPLPYRQQQVPEWIRGVLPGRVLAAAYGFLLGVGFLTLFTYSAQLAMVVTLGFLTSLTEILGVLLAYALGKTLVLGTGLGAASDDEIFARFEWTRARLRVLRTTAGVSSLVVAILLVGETYGGG